MSGMDWLGIDEWPAVAIDGLMDDADQVKRGLVTGGLEGKVLAMVFMNPSLRTRASMETAMFLHGGHALNLEPGKGSWALETDLDAVMDGSTAEHIVEAARVLSRYADALAIRSFPSGNDWQVAREDAVVRTFAREATVPVINLESARRHPCQGLADAMTIRERIGDTLGRRFVLQWAWHPHPLPTAVPTSAALAAAHLGMEVTIARPPGYDLDPDDMEAIRSVAAARGGSFRTSDDLDEAIPGADVVYAKSWGSLALFGRPNEEAELRAPLRDWRLTAERLATTAGSSGFAMHCLPVRRNVVIDAAVLDGPRSAVVDQAENRLHAQRALLLKLIGG